MFPWLRRNLQSGIGPLNLENDLNVCMKDQISYDFSCQDLCAQFSGSSEIKEAKALAAQGNNSDAANALGEHFLFRVHPKSIAQHSNISALRERLNKMSAPVIQSIIDKANQVIEHRFTVGSGVSYHFQRGIDWFSDFTGNSWPRFHIAEMERRFNEGEELTADPMGSLAHTWELNRHAHFLTLGRAYWLTGTETYAAEFIVQAVRWCQENPPLLGINWYDPTTVAIRTINWLLAIGMFIESPQLQPSQMAMFVETLLNHGALLAHWLKQKKVNPSLPLIVALSMLAEWMPEVRYADSWRSLAEKHWEEALKADFNEDHFHHSASPTRQILSCEWLLLLGLQNEASRQRLPHHLEDVLNDVLDSLQCLLSPCGLLYSLGGYPHDEGFMGHMCSQAEHVRNLLAIGAVLTHRADLYYNQPSNPMEMLWWMGESGWSNLKELSIQCAPNTAYLFSKTGLGVSRNSWEPKSTHFIFRATPTSSLDGKDEALKQLPPSFLFHNDALSLSLTIEDEPFILEPGLAADINHHDFRLSRLCAHSAPRLSNELEPPFSKADSAILNRLPSEPPQAIYCSQLVGQKPNNQDQVQFGARRYAYCPDGNRVTITRHVIFMPSEKVLILRDKLEGEGEVPYECNFLLAPHLYLMMRGDMGCRMLGNKTNVRIIPHMPKKSYYTKYKGNGKPFLGWVYNPQGQLTPANYLSYAHRSVSLPNKMYFVIHWDSREADLPQPEAIDKLIGE